MRGIIPVVFLQVLEKSLRENGGEQDIAKYFDLIAGTSTGGLISLALSCSSSLPHQEHGGSDQIDLAALLENYLTMGSEIFQAISFYTFRQIVSNKYNSGSLQNLAQRWFGAETMQNAKVPTLIMSYDLTAGQPQMIRSYADESSYPVWVAARSTSAAPTYFSPCEYEGKLLVDGGVAANNPAIYAYFEAKRLFPRCSKFHILSISTGGTYHTMTKDETRGLMNWAEQVSPLYSTAQKRTADFVMENIPDADYVRFDDALSIHVKMDEVNPAILQRIKTEAKNNVLKHGQTIENFTKQLIANMEFRNNAS